VSPVSDLITSLSHHPAALAVACTVGVLALQLAVGWAYDHRVEIRGSWADGREWLSARRRDTARVGRRAAGASWTALLWLLAHVLRAHGHHRAVAP